MTFLGVFLLSVHFLLLVILCLFGLHRFSMVLRWFRYRRVGPRAPKLFTELPKVTVQIPLYNERLVAKRIIDSIVLLNYPPDRLQIQIVDDSNDDTLDIVAERVAYHQANGVNIEHVQRASRQGFKAGALRAAMERADGELIAIFDADFIPDPDTLTSSVHYFSQADIAMVQLRWEHLNRRSSLLSKTQAIMLDAHFGLEQQVRCASGMLFNFNGTAGIWRTSAIIDAGNWSADTLTEDLDLSYRAQLAGWKMLYLNHLACPGEIPADMNAFKTQQYRWAKGGVQVLMKMLRPVWQSNLPFTKKLESTFHLGNNLAYLVMLVDTLFFLVPSLYLREKYDFVNVWWLDIPLLILSSGGHLFYFFFGQVALGRSKIRALVKTPSLVLLGIQLAINNSKAGLEALAGKESEFVRTPKTGELEENRMAVEGIGLAGSSLDKKQEYRPLAPKGAIFELVIAGVYTLVLLWAISHEYWFMLPFVFLLATGFVLSSINSLYSHYQLSR